MIKKIGQKMFNVLQNENGTLTMKKQVECEHFNIGDKNSNEVA
jgi:hypothetical protein